MAESTTPRSRIPNSQNFLFAGRTASCGDEPAHWGSIESTDRGSQIVLPMTRRRAHPDPILRNLFSRQIAAATSGLTSLPQKWFPASDDRVDTHQRGPHPNSSSQRTIWAALAACDSAHAANASA